MAFSRLIRDLRTSIRVTRRHKLRLKRRGNPRKVIGFTIVELLIVVVVIGVLAAIVTVSYMGIQTQARINIAKSDISEMKKAMLHYKSLHGELPAKGDSSTVVLDPAECDRWPTILDAIYAEGMVKKLHYIDPWNHCYAYDDNDCNSEAPPGEASWIKSAGPDGILHNSDDIVITITDQC